MFFVAFRRGRGRLGLDHGNWLGFFRLGVGNVEATGQVLELEFHILVDQHLLLGEKLRNFPRQHLLGLALGDRLADSRLHG